jgi:hypothetical protein
VIGANGGISHSNLTNYQSPTKDVSASNPHGIPRKYAHLTNPSTNSQNPNTVRIRDNRSATPDRTVSPNEKNNNSCSRNNAPGLKT